MEHVTPVTPITPITRSRNSPALPLLWAGGLAAIALVAILAAATSSPGRASGSNGNSTGNSTGILAAAASADASADTAGGGWQRGAALGALGFDRGPGGPGIGGPGHAFGRISITAISGSQINLRTDNGWTRTIDAANADVYRGETAIALSDLRVGDQIAFREVRNTDGTTTVTRIRLLDPSVVGTIMGLGDSSVTVRLADGSTQTVQTTALTTFRLGRETVARDQALVVGNLLHAVGTRSAETLTATAIAVAPATVAGEVTGTSASSITVSDATGASKTINVSSATRYRVRGDDTPSLDDIAVGDMIVAQGTLAAGGALDATVVADGGRGHGLGGFGPARGGRGHHGRGGHDGPNPNATPAPSSSSGTSGSSDS